MTTIITTNYKSLLSKYSNIESTLNLLNEKKELYLSIDNNGYRGNCYYSKQEIERMNIHSVFNRIESLSVEIEALHNGLRSLESQYPSLVVLRKALNLYSINRVRNVSINNSLIDLQKAYSLCINDIATTLVF